VKDPVLNKGKNIRSELGSRVPKGPMTYIIKVCFEGAPVKNG